MIILMWLPVASVAISLGAAWVMTRRPAIDQRNDGVRRAADDLSLVIGSLRDITWRAKHIPPDATVLADAVLAVDLSCRIHEGRLPDGMRHLRQSVRAAVTNYLGGPACVSLSPQARDWDVDPHDEYFWELAVGYLDLALQALAQWRDRPGASCTLPMYHAYRRDDDAEYFAERRGA